MTPCLPPPPPPPSHAASTALQDDIEDDCVPAGAGEIHVGCSVRLRAPGLEGDGCATLRRQTSLPTAVSDRRLHISASAALAALGTSTIRPADAFVIRPADTSTTRMTAMQVHRDGHRLEQ